MAARPTPSPRQRQAAYQLEQLYVDQHPDHVVDAIPAVLAWVPASVTAVGPFQFQVERGRRARSSRRIEELSVGWNIDALRRHDASVEERAGRMRSGRTPQREHVTELAAYGLALVAISVYLPGKRVESWNRGHFPDILFDASPDALRGVEVAGRTTGGWSALRRVLEGSARDAGKIDDLWDATNIKEGHVAVWCRTPRVAVMLKVKP